MSGNIQSNVTDLYKTFFFFSYFYFFAFLSELDWRMEKFVRYPDSLLLIDGNQSEMGRGQKRQCPDMTLLFYFYFKLGLGFTDKKKSKKLGLGFEWVGYKFKTWIKSLVLFEVPWCLTAFALGSSSAF